MIDSGSKNSFAPLDISTLGIFAGTRPLYNLNPLLLDVSVGVSLVFAPI